MSGMSSSGTGPAKPEVDAEAGTPAEPDAGTSRKSGGRFSLHSDAGSTGGGDYDSMQGKMGEIPLMSGEEIMIDDYDAALVITIANEGFDDTSDPGELKDEDMVKDPLGEAKKIFLRDCNQYSSETLKDIEATLKQSMHKAKYKKAILKKLLNIMETSGFKVSSFKSIDGDEIFVRVGLDKESSVMQQLAERYRYMMPYSEESYKGEEAVGEFFPGGCCPKDGSGEAVPAYGPYKIANKDSFQPFRKVDEMRIILMQFQEWACLEQCKEQGIINAFFACANYAQMMELSDKWASRSMLFSLPNFESDDMIRGYFGEKLAFSFQWFAFYTRSLGWLAVAGILGIVSMAPVGLTVQRATKTMSFLATVIWAALFNQGHKNLVGRCKQRWGVEHAGNLMKQRADYDPFLEGTWKLAFLRTGTNMVAFMLMTIFIGMIGQINVYKRHCIEHGWPDYSAIMVTIVIQGFGFIWMRYCPAVAAWQNHRFQEHYENALVTLLASVKVFFGVFAFFSTAFLVKYSDVHCADTLVDAANHVYFGKYPPHTSPNDLSFLDHYWFSSDNAEKPFCIYGCYPMGCDKNAAGEVTCTTNCNISLEASLFTTYIVNIVMMVIFLIIPVLIIRVFVKLEMRSATTGGAAYSFLQVQAKMQDQAGYFYNSWGGDYVLDNLGNITGFTILVCFGQMQPILSVIGFITNIIAYRLMAFRMVNVTGRPMPDVAQGIGAWENVIDMICKVALVINVALVVFVSEPMRSKSMPTRLTAFFVLEHGLVLLQTCAKLLVPSVPADVTLIVDINHDFAEKQGRTWEPLANDEKIPQYNYDDIDLSINDGPVQNNLSAAPAPADSPAPAASNDPQGAPAASNEPQGATGAADEK